MTSTPGTAKALDAAALAACGRLSGPLADPPAWLQFALRLHQNAAGVDAIAVALRAAGYPEEAVELAVAAVRSDMRRLGLFWSRLHLR